MKAKEIRDLIDFIAGSGLEEVNIETEEFKINVKRSLQQGTSGPATPPQQALSNFTPPASAHMTSPSTPVNEPKKEAPASDDAKLVTIHSPMIGTFYRTPNPDSDPFVKVGDTIKQGETVCIIEAMKLFNEIESEVSGKIVKILVENAQPVEYDQPLFLVDPS